MDYQIEQVIYIVWLIAKYSTLFLVIPYVLYILFYERCYRYKILRDYYES
jgi:hypothetical protein